MNCSTQQAKGPREHQLFYFLYQFLARDFEPLQRHVPPSVFFLQEPDAAFYFLKTGWLPKNGAGNQEKDGASTGAMKKTGLSKYRSV